MLFFTTLHASIDLKENFFESCHGNAIAQDPNLMHAVVKLLKETLKLRCLLVANLESDLL